MQYFLPILMARFSASLMEGICAYIDEVIVPEMKVRPYGAAKNRLQIWLESDTAGGEPPLLASEVWKGAFRDNRVMDWMSRQAAHFTLEGLQLPNLVEAALVHKAGTIGNHRDARYAGAFSLLWNLRGTTEFIIYPERPLGTTGGRWEIGAPKLYNLGPGEVVLFNPKSSHLTRNSSADRLSINTWTINPIVRDDYVAFRNTR